MASCVSTCTLTFLHTHNGQVIIGNGGRKIAHIIVDKQQSGNYVSLILIS